MPVEAGRLLGRWEKVTAGAAAQLYPDVLEFRAAGLYRGRKLGPPGGFTCWDAGEYRPEGPHRIRISTASDVHVVYEYWLEEEGLKFRDAEGREIEYRRGS